MRPSCRVVWRVHVEVDPTSPVSNIEAISTVGAAAVRVEDLADNLRSVGGGLWTSSASADLSYPSEGHSQCFAIEEDSFWFRHRNAVISDVMRRFPPSGTVFDIGGGNGYVTAGLIRAGYEAVLVEPGLDGARNAIRRGLNPVLCTTLDEAGFRPASIPAAGLFDVVEHIEDDAGFLRRLRGLMPPGGRLYVTVPTTPWLWSVDDERAGHFRRYTVASIRKVLSTAGFEVEFASPFFGFLVAPVFLRRAIPGRLGLRSDSGDEYVAEHTPPSPRVQRVLEWFCSAELKRLGRGKRLRLGSSCLVVARAAQ